MGGINYNLVDEDHLKDTIWFALFCFTFCLFFLPLLERSLVLEDIVASVIWLACRMTEVSFPKC